MDVTSKKNQALWEEMNGASDRAVAIVATSYLNDNLEAALRAQLRADDATSNKLFKISGPLGGWGRRWISATCLGSTPLKRGTTCLRWLG